MTRRISTGLLMLAVFFPMRAQQALSLEQCRHLALSNNKQLAIAKMKQDVAENARHAAKTKFLPRVNALGGYEFFSREVSLLSSNQKDVLNNLGSTTVSNVSTGLTNTLTELVQNGMLTPEMAAQMGSQANQLLPSAAEKGNELGHSVVNGLSTDTKHIWAGAITVTQPIYMGGAISALNRIAEIGEEMAANDVDNKEQSVLYTIDNAYWLAVSLRQKKELADSYLSLVRKLSDDVNKLINEGIATRSDGLKVDVAVNAAEMQVTQVDNGLKLSKMYLCQLCGLPLDGTITLVDENKESIPVSPAIETEVKDSTFSLRPEIRLLQNAISLSEESTNLVRSLYRPHIGLTAGYLVSNPNVFNGFERKFGGVFNIGILVQVPIWSWNEGRYRINATKTATAIAKMELSDAQEKINLQIEQQRFKLTEANKKMALTQKSMASAEENLRCANLGFKEGVMTITDVMTAQTAWQQAKGQVIDAEIEVKLAQLGLQKALGTINY